MKGYEIPEYSRTAKGIPVINLLGISSGENIQAVINIGRDNGDEDNENRYLFFTTLNGVTKRTPVAEFLNIRSNGLKAISLKENDEVINVVITDGKQNIIIGTHNGYA